MKKTAPKSANDTPKNEIMYEKGEEKLHLNRRRKRKQTTTRLVILRKENSNPDNVVVLDLKVNKITTWIR